MKVVLTNKNNAIVINTSGKVVSVTIKHETPTRVPNSIGALGADVKQSFVQQSDTRSLVTKVYEVLGLCCDVPIIDTDKGNINLKGVFSKSLMAKADVQIEFGRRFISVYVSSDGIEACAIDVKPYTKMVEEAVRNLRSEMSVKYINRYGD